MEYWKGIYKLSEECGELIQLLGKAGPFPVAPHPDGNGPVADRFNEEIADVYAALDYFVTENRAHLNSDSIQTRRARKREQFRQWGLDGIIKDGDS